MKKEALDLMEAQGNQDPEVHLAHQGLMAKLENKAHQVYLDSLEAGERKENMEIWDLQV